MDTLVASIPIDAFIGDIIPMELVALIIPIMVMVPFIIMLTWFIIKDCTTRQWR